MHRQELDIFSDLSMHRCPVFNGPNCGKTDSWYLHNQSFFVH